MQKYKDYTAGRHQWIRGLQEIPGTLSSEALSIMPTNLEVVSPILRAGMVGVKC
ncbi:hypothetical protein J5X98_22765 [Leptothermofonsia sichuanensis E412]|uniref:hypothetical protein n=1 Tax=Leptothermofonsia sichuanensis TaxID=2917832 RepID=UPI001CA71DBE|nr:hypothetical protein [Leptothermofonsia sichuanensis]QZZ20075.1 hypothetical protein J5X98_22765 [Leptothermofonsia sichuanensis E412]